MTTQRSDYDGRSREENGVVATFRRAESSNLCDFCPKNGSVYEAEMTIDGTAIGWSDYCQECADEYWVCAEESWAAAAAATPRTDSAARTLERLHRTIVFLAAILVGALTFRLIADGIAQLVDAGKTPAPTTIPTVVLEETQDRIVLGVTSVHPRSMMKL